MQTESKLREGEKQRKLRVGKVTEMNNGDEQQINLSTCGVLKERCPAAVVSLLRGV